MTLLPATTSRPSLFSELLGQMLADSPLFARTGLVLTFSLIPTLAAFLLDPRVFQGDDIWLKPIKFQIALAIYLFTLAAFARWLPERMAGATWFRTYQIVVVACIAAEMAWIAGAAALGTASHFNMSSPAAEALYRLMGVLAVTLTSASLVWGVAIARNADSGLAPSLHHGLALGLILTFPLTVVIAGTMAAGTGHLVGTPITGARLWLLGWSREVGDLRAAHLLATHALHAVPAAALAAHLTLPPKAALLATWAAAAGFTALTLGTFAIALMGLPLI